MIPVTTVQYIVTEMNNIHIMAKEVMGKKIIQLLKIKGLSSESVDEITRELSESDPFVESINLLKTNFKRNKFYKNHFQYVQPVSITIDSQKKTFFSYIPIEETIKLFFSDKSIKDDISLLSNVESCDSGRLKDFTDGSEYQTNRFFTNNEEALQLILFQDGFEIVNPIGSAKKKHKLLGIYLTLGNLPDSTRNHINNIKLVALCKEKEFNHDVVYGTIVEDLKKIERDGVTIQGKNIPGSLIFISGDNLGSHSLGGFIENFSKCEYICRYCLATRSELKHDNGWLEKYELRNIDQHNEAISKVGSNKDYEGVKFDSVFNNLEFYNVISPGLPPCLGHDLLEGIVAFDMFLIVEKLIKAKWFNFDILNKRIRQFKYTSKDLRDKPCQISKASKRITVGAIQVWNMLRLFPLMVSDLIKDPENEVWLCLLLLIEIVEIVISPIINENVLDYLNELIREFLTLRIRLFVNENVRPKHHYLSHYPDLIHKYGPLIKVWTLRFESKHTYFKKVVRHTHNFINILKTLSEKYGLFQCLLRLGSDLRQTEKFDGITVFDSLLYNEDLVECIENANLEADIQQCNKVTVKGTVYEKGSILFLSQDIYQYKVTMGKIRLLLLQKDTVHFVLEVLNTVFQPHIRAFELQETFTYECHPLSSLTYYKPISVYKIGHINCAKPDHGFVAECL